MEFHEVDRKVFGARLLYRKENVIHPDLWVGCDLNIYEARLIFLF